MAAAGVPMVGGGPTVELIYGKPMLPDVSRVLACLYEKEVEFKLVDMHQGQHMPQDFLRLQAAARLPVPCLKDGDTTLFESRAICRHLVDKYNDSGNKYLLGRDSLQRVSIEQWLKLEEHSFDPPSWRLIFHLAFPPATGLPDPDRALITESERRLNEVLDVYEQRLGERKYLASNEFSLADLSHLSNSHFLATSKEWGYLFNKRKNVSRWWSKISNRPSWKEVVKLLDELETSRGTRPPAVKSVVQSLSKLTPSSPGMRTIIQFGHIPGYTDTTSHQPPSVATPSAQPDSSHQQSRPQPVYRTPSAQTTPKTQLTSTGQSSCQPPLTAPTTPQSEKSESVQPILPLALSTGQSTSQPLLVDPTTTRQPSMPAPDQSNPPLNPNSLSIQPASASQIDPKLNTTIQPIGPNAKKKPAQGPTSPSAPPAQTASEGQRTAQRTIQPAGPGTSSSLPPVVPGSQSSSGRTPTVPATSPTPQPGTPEAQPGPRMKKDSQTDSTTSNNISPPENDVNSTAKTTLSAQTASGGPRTSASAQGTIQPAGPGTSSSLPSVIPSSWSSSGTTPTVPATSPTPQPGTPEAQPGPRMKKDSQTDSTTSNNISPPENDVNSMAKTTPPAQTASGGPRTSASASAPRTIQPAGPGTSSSLPSLVPSSQSSRGTTPTVPASALTPQQGTPKTQPGPQMKKDSQTDSTTSNNISPPENDVNSTAKTTPPAQTASGGQRTSASAQRAIQPAGPDASSNLPSLFPSSQSSSGTTPTVPVTSPTPQPGTPKVQPDPQMKKDPRTDSTTSSNISLPENDVNSMAKTTPPAQTASEGPRTLDSAQLTIQPAGPDTSNSLPPVVPGSQSNSGTTPTVPATSPTPQLGTPKAQPDPRMKKDSRIDSTASNNISPLANTDVNSRKTTSFPAKTASDVQPSASDVQPFSDSSKSTRQPVVEPGTSEAQPDLESKQVSQTDSADPNVKPTAKPESTQATSAYVQPSLQQTDPGTPITPLQELVSRLKENMKFRPSTQKEPSIPSQPTSASAQPTAQPDAEDTMTVNPSTKSSTSRDPMVPDTPLTSQQGSPEAQPDLQTKQATSNVSPTKSDVNSKKTATPPAQTAPIAQQTPAPKETNANSMEKTTPPSQSASNDKTTSASSQFETTLPNSKSAPPPNLTTQSGAQSAPTSDQSTPPSTSDQSTPPSTGTESTSLADPSGESTDKPSPPQST